MCDARSGGCCGRERQLQLGNAGGHFVILCRHRGGKLLDDGVAACRCGGLGARVPVELFYKGHKGALAAGRICHGLDISAMGLYVRGRSSEHVASPRRHSRFASKRLVEGEEEFLPRLQCMLGGELAISTGLIVEKKIGLEEGVCVDGREEILREGEVSAHQLLMGVLERVELLRDVGVLLPYFLKRDKEVDNFNALDDPARNNELGKKLYGGGTG